MKSYIIKDIQDIQDIFMKEVQDIQCGKLSFGIYRDIEYARNARNAIDAPIKEESSKGKLPKWFGFVH